MNLNEIVTNLYLIFFDYQQYQKLLTEVHNNNDFASFGYILILLPLAMFIFYKLLDPVRKQLFWWAVSITVIAVITYSSTTAILYSNYDLLAVIGNSENDPNAPDGNAFIVKMSMISLFYASIISFLYSLLFKRFFSSNNSHNPF